MHLAGPANFDGNHRALVVVVKLTAYIILKLRTPVHIGPHDPGKLKLLGPGSKSSILSASGIQITAA